MNTTTRTSTAERLGRTLGRGWRAYARGEQRALNWLVFKGMPATGATVLLWVVKLAVIGALLYSAFWLALLLVGLLFVARGFGKGDYDFSLPREELRHGMSVRAAIDAGFKKAFATIVDSNITVLIAALVLFQFGTGAIKGFALVLTIGVITSMFTATMMSRGIIERVLGKRRIQKLYI